MSKYKIDSYLDAFAAKHVNDGEPYKWWWNGCDVLTEAIASQCRHLRKDGTTFYSTAELIELRTLEKYMRKYGMAEFLDLSVVQRQWLHAEAMWLLGAWFKRFWD